LPTGIGYSYKKLTSSASR